MAKLRFTRWVPDDLYQALAWYDSRSAALGTRFRAEMDAAFTAIEKSPQSFPSAFPDLDVRFYRLRRFPYLVVYRANQSGTLVIGVWHGASDSRKWRERVVRTS